MTSAPNASGPLSFTYRDAQGNERAWTVEGWKESGKYIQGVCTQDRKFRTFRKDRVIDYMDGMEAQLFTPRPAPPPPPDDRADVLFTGLPKARRAELEALAEGRRMRVRKTVTQGLVFLCCGANAGPTKVEAAREKGCYILDEEMFLAMLETGEVPSD